MSWIAAPLGLLACASMSAAACCHAAPSRESSHSSHHKPQPREAPDQPGGCHAVLGCAAHRKLRTIA